MPLRADLPRTRDINSEEGIDRARTKVNDHARTKVSDHARINNNGTTRVVSNRGGTDPNSTAEEPHRLAAGTTAGLRNEQRADKFNK